LHLGHKAHRSRGGKSRHPRMCQRQPFTAANVATPCASCGSQASAVRRSKATRGSPAPRSKPSQRTAYLRQRARSVRRIEKYIGSMQLCSRCDALWCSNSADSSLNPHEICKNVCHGSINSIVKVARRDQGANMECPHGARSLCSTWTITSAH
jgi:hypothetical protein